MASTVTDALERLRQLKSMDGKGGMVARGSSSEDVAPGAPGPVGSVAPTKPDRGSGTVTIIEGRDLGRPASLSGETNLSYLPVRAPVMDMETATAAAAQLLRALGLDLDNEHLVDTPTRMVKGLVELLTPTEFKPTSFSNPGATGTCQGIEANGS